MMWRLRRAAPTARQVLPHLLLGVAVLAFGLQGLGYRALWQDEIETAERARTIVESGLPLVIDRSGELSVNWGGHELDEGAVHRYNTWGQFYFGALGLAVGRVIGMDRDAAVRLPFVAAHAATAGLVSYGISTLAGASLPLSLAAGAIVSLQTPRILHNRTARYHGLLDVLVLLGLVAIGAWRQRTSWGKWLFATALFLLPHTHLFGGAVLGLGLAVLAMHVSIARPEIDWRNRLREAALYIVAPGLISLALWVWLVRPWARTAMGGSLAIDLFRLLSFETMANTRHLGYAGAAVLIGLALLVYQRRWGTVLTLGIGTVTVVMAVRILDFNALTQSFAYRYYLAAPLLGLFWPVALGLDPLRISGRNILVLTTCVVALSPDLLPSRTGERPFQPFWGVRLVLSDREHARAGDKQPLHRALDMIRERARPADPVAIDYVPQFVPWYLPGHATALVPDPVGRHDANFNNPVWARPMLFPRWHLRYSEWPNGTWPCAPRCDYHSFGNLEQGHYELTSMKLGRTETFCVHGLWPTHPWNNAPFMNYKAAALNPEGTVDGALVLGGPCPGALR